MGFALPAAIWAKVARREADIFRRRGLTSI